MSKSVFFTLGLLASCFTRSAGGCAVAMHWTGAAIERAMSPNTVKVESATQFQPGFAHERRQLVRSTCRRSCGQALPDQKNGGAGCLCSGTAPSYSNIGEHTICVRRRIHSCCHGERAYPDDEVRALVLGVVLEEIVSSVRGLPGSDRLRAPFVFDEVYGVLPPHPANPPTKRPSVLLMTQARAYWVGVVMATQGPAYLDYRAVSNAGVWCLRRLRTDADRARVLDGRCRVECSTQRQ